MPYTFFQGRLGSEKSFVFFHEWTLISLSLCQGSQRADQNLTLPLAMPVTSRIKSGAAGCIVMSSRPLFVLQNMKRVKSAWRSHVSLTDISLLKSSFEEKKSLRCRIERDAWQMWHIFCGALRCIVNCYITGVENVITERAAWWKSLPEQIQTRIIIWFFSSWMKLTHLNHTRLLPKVRPLRTSRSRSKNHHIIHVKTLINLNYHVASEKFPHLCRSGAVTPAGFGHISLIWLDFLFLNPRVELLKVIHQVYSVVVRLPEEDLDVLTGLLHRASSQCNTLLPPKEGECAHSLTPQRSDVQVVRYTRRTILYAS